MIPENPGRKNRQSWENEPSECIELYLETTCEAGGVSTSGFGRKAPSSPALSTDELPPVRTVGETHTPKDRFVQSLYAVVVRV